MSVQDRVDRFLRTGDAPVIDGFDALHEAAELFREAPDLVELVAQLFWLRFTTRPSTPAGDADMSTMFALIMGMGPASPETTPRFLKDGLPRYWTAYETYVRANVGGQQEAIDRAFDLTQRGIAAATTADLRHAADDCRYAARFVSRLHPASVRALTITFVVLHACFHREQEAGLLTDAEQAARETLAIADRAAGGHAEALFNLIACLISRRRFEQADTLGECAELGRQLAALSIADPDLWLTVTLEAGQALQRLAREEGDPEVGSAAADLLLAAVRAAAAQPPGARTQVSLVCIAALRYMGD